MSDLVGNPEDRFFLASRLILVYSQNLVILTLIFRELLDFSKTSVGLENFCYSLLLI